MAMRTRTLAGTFLVAALISGCSGGGGDSPPGAGLGGAPPGSPPPPAGSPPPPPPAPASTILSTQAEASRFLTQASFGGDYVASNALVGRTAESWLQAEFAKPPRLILDTVLASRRPTGGFDGSPASEQVWNGFISGDDTLRQRMVFALSQIWVVSENEMFDKNERMAFYVDTLSRNAFGNYRQLMQDVTYTPAMAEYLTYMQNRKGDPRTGRMPDENYAREILQLFTIGLVELNMDGTPKIGPNGPRETYTNADIEGLARVFTGLSRKGRDFYRADPDGEYQPLVMMMGEHSPEAKTFLGTTIPAGTEGNESIRIALDTIFAHPNVAPYVSIQLIKRFTASNPSPAYVQRVATAFETGSFTAPSGIRFGTGTRGDLTATLAAVLLDPTVHQDPASLPQDAGKIREPILKFVHLARAFRMNPAVAAVETRLDNTSSPVDRLAQHPFRAPSVFNFYRPGFVAPGSLSGAANLTAPEFQIINDGSSLGYINMMTDYAFDRTPSRNNVASFVPDYAAEIAIADDAKALVERLNVTLAAGQMTAQEKAAVEAAINALPISTTDPSGDRQKRVASSVLLISNMPSYAVIR